MDILMPRLWLYFVHVWKVCWKYFHLLQWKWEWSWNRNEYNSPIAFRMMRYQKIEKIPIERWNKRLQGRDNVIAHTHIHTWVCVFRCSNDVYLHSIFRFKPNSHFVTIPWFHILYLQNERNKSTFYFPVTMGLVCVIRNCESLVATVSLFITIITTP